MRPKCLNLMSSMLIGTFSKVIIFLDQKIQKRFFYGGNEDTLFLMKNSKKKSFLFIVRPKKKN